MGTTQDGHTAVLLAGRGTAGGVGTYSLLPMMKQHWREAAMELLSRWLGSCVGVGALVLCAATAMGQVPSGEPAFAVAVIRPSAASVAFERNGHTEVDHGRLQMRDVTVSSCVQWAYGLTEGLLVGPAALRGVRYDVTAKAEASTTEAQMRAMMRTLLRERFGLQFHQEARELHVYTLVVAKAGPRLKPAAPDAVFFRENSATGTVARGMTMAQLAQFLSEPLEAPVTDGTGLPGRYDFSIDFTPYVELERQAGDVKPDVVAVLETALKGDLGLALVRKRQTVEVTVVDRVASPSEN